MEQMERTEYDLTILAMANRGNGNGRLLEDVCEEVVGIWPGRFNEFFPAVKGLVQRGDLTCEERAVPIGGVSRVRGASDNWTTKRFVYSITEQGREHAMKATKTATDPKVRKARTPKTTKAKGRDPRLPAVGTILKVIHKGKPAAMKVLEDGFEMSGNHYKSISAAAMAITGRSTNGFLFWGLIGNKKSAVKVEPKAAPKKAQAKPKAPKAKRGGKGKDGKKAAGDLDRTVKGSSEA